MKWFVLTSLLFLTLVASGCSYSTSFVIVNDADYSIEVSYRIKAVPAGPRFLDVPPGVISAADIETRDREKWTKLGSDHYRIDQVNRTVIVTLAPHEALWVTSMSHYIGGIDPNDVQDFPIQDISISGSEGEMKFTGDQARQSFERESQVLYLLRYK